MVFRRKRYWEGGVQENSRSGYTGQELPLVGTRNWAIYWQFNGTVIPARGRSEEGESGGFF